MASSASASEVYPKSERHQYAEENALQYLSVWFPRPLPPGDAATGYWIIYIHGGAWRDPIITASTIDTTKNVLVSRYGDILPQIDAIASINYRLSAHPAFHQHLDIIEPRIHRNATHPEHLNDVCTAINYLQSKYGFGSRYILVGHSCGATLAFQTVMGRVINQNPSSATVSLTTQPIAIFGVEGIYDLRSLRDSYAQHTIYQEFIEGAFGPSEDLWDAVSPARVTGDDGVEGGWKNGVLAVLAHSKDDELVDNLQMESMAMALQGWKASDPQRRVVCIDDLTGGHDTMWQDGQELAAVIAMSMEELNDIVKAA